MFLYLVYTNLGFQSTPSVWRETFLRQFHQFLKTISIHSLRVEGDKRLYCADFLKAYFNPLPPCGGRLPPSILFDIPHDFNPLPPCGGRLSASVSYLHQSVFQSTPSVWRETEIFICMRNGFNYFNPLPPCGGRLKSLVQQHSGTLFQSTPSVWRETVW